MADIAIRLWPKDYERKEYITRGEKSLLRFAGENFVSGHFAVGIDPIGMSTDKVKMGLYISPTQGLITFSVYQGPIEEKNIQHYILAVKLAEDRIHNRLLDSKMLIVRNGDYKKLKFPYKHVIVFVEETSNSIQINSEQKKQLASFATFKSFMPLTSSVKIRLVKELNLFTDIRKTYDHAFKEISDLESRAIFERLAPEYTVVMNEKEDIKLSEKKDRHTDDEIFITGNELEYKTFFLDEYQVGLVNEMGKGHRVILANPGAGKSVLLLSKAFKYASVYKKSNVLLTCYNNNLADLYNFKRSCADFGASNNLFIMTFHKLVKKIYEECLHMRCTDVYPNDDEIGKCADYIKAGKVKLRFIAIFIDEVQIFNPLYLEICYLLLDDSPDRVFLMAGDLNQTVRTQSRRGDAPWKRIHGVNLDFSGRVRYIEKNYRNSREIAEYLNHMLAHMNNRLEMLNMINIKEFQYDTFVIGNKHSIALEVKTGINRGDIQKSVLAAVDEIVSKYKIPYSDIAILFPVKQHETFKYFFLNWLKRAFDNSGIPCSMIMSTDWNTFTRHKYSTTTGIVLSTIDSSLGLDFKAVIVAGLFPYNYVVDNEGKFKKIKDWAGISKMNADAQENVRIQMRKIYTACSRAREVLYVLSDLTSNSPMEDILLERRDSVERQLQYFG